MTFRWVDPPLSVICGVQVPLQNAPYSSLAAVGGLLVLGLAGRVSAQQVMELVAVWCVLLQQMGVDQHIQQVPCLTDADSSQSSGAKGTELRPRMQAQQPEQTRTVAW